MARRAKRGRRTQERRTQDPRALFLSLRGARLNVRAVRLLVHKYGALGAEQKRPPPPRSPALLARRTCSAAGPTCAPSRRCSATLRSRRRSAIRTCRSSTCRRCTPRPIRSPRRPESARHSLRDGRRAKDRVRPRAGGVAAAAIVALVEAGVAEREGRGGRGAPAFGALFIADVGVLVPVALVVALGVACLADLPRTAAISLSISEQSRSRPCSRSRSFYARNAALAPLAIARTLAWAVALRARRTLAPRRRLPSPEGVTLAASALAHRAPASASSSSRSFARSGGPSRWLAGASGAFLNPIVTGGGGARRRGRRRGVGREARLTRGAGEGCSGSSAS